MPHSKTLTFSALVVAGGMALASSASAQWIKAETEHFVIYSESGAKDTRDYASRLETFNKVANSFYDQMSPETLPDFQKTRFTYFSRVGEFTTVEPTLESGFRPVDGCAEGSEYFSTSDAQSNNNLYGGGAIDNNIDLNLAYLYFAYNEHLLDGRFSTMPDWARDGLNWYFMTAVFKDGKIMIGRQPPNIGMSFEPDGRIEDLTRKKNIIPFADIIAGKPIPPDEQDMAALEHWVMVSYLMIDPDRRTKFFAYLRAVNDGTDSAAAFQQTVGIDPDSFKPVMNNDINKGVSYMVFAADALPDAAVTITDLPRYDAPVPMIAAALNVCPTPEHGAKLLATLRKTAPKFADDPFTQKTLAHAEIDFGDANAALPILTGQLTADPKDVEAQFLLGRLYLTLAERAGNGNTAQDYANARRELGKAYTLNPASPPILYYFARASADQPNYPDDNTLTAAQLAVDYSNGYYDYDMYLAELLLRRDRYADAQALIDKRLPFNGDKKSAAKHAVLTALHDGLSAHKPKADILPLFAQYAAFN